MSGKCRLRGWKSIALLGCFLVAGLPLESALAEGSPEAQHVAQVRPLPGQRRVPADPDLSPKQRRDLVKHNFEKMKQDADELLELANSLHEQVGEMTENMLSLEVAEKADKIEKLAKRIKNTARGR